MSGLRPQTKFWNGQVWQIESGTVYGVLEKPGLTSDLTGGVSFSVFSGSTTPSSGLGVDGDLYFQTGTTGVVGASLLNADGGLPDSVYGGITPIDCNGP